MPPGYSPTTCGEGYTQVDTFLSGTTTYYKCEENDCDGFPLSQQPTNCANIQTCMHGKTPKYRCDLCQTGWTGSTCDSAAEGYIKQDDNVYIIKDCQNGSQLANSCICNQGWTGEFCENENECLGYNDVNCIEPYAVSEVCFSGITPKYKCNACISGYKMNGSVCEKMDDFSGFEGDYNNSVLTFDNDMQYHNVTVYHGNSNMNVQKISNTDAKIKVTNNSDGTITALSSGKNLILTKNFYRSEDYTLMVTADIEMNNHGNGNIYGINLGDNEGIGSNLYFAPILSSPGTGKPVDIQADANILLNNVGNGNVYGIYKTIKKNSSTYANPSDTARENFGNVYVEPISSIKRNEDIEGKISISNIGNGDVYGLYANVTLLKSDPDYSPIVYNLRSSSSDREDTTLDVKSSIIIDNTGNGNVYGLYTSSGYITNIKGSFIDHHDSTQNRPKQEAVIDINYSGQGNAYGMYGDIVYSIDSSWQTISQGGISSSIPTFYSSIILTNTQDGNIFGIYGAHVKHLGYNSLNSTEISSIKLNNEHKGNAIGIYVNKDTIGPIYTAANQYTDEVSANEGHIYILNQDDGSSVGMYAHEKEILNNRSGNNNGIIELINVKNGWAVGMYAKDGIIRNKGEIKIHHLKDGVAVGIYADGSTEVINSGSIIIDRPQWLNDDVSNKIYSSDLDYYGGVAVGIYAASGAKITNTGTIDIRTCHTNTENQGKTIGIFAENGAEIHNTGTIYLNGSGSTGWNNYGTVFENGNIFQDGNLIVENNTQNSPMSVSSVKPASLNLNDFGGTVVASGTSQFIVEGSISGDLAINNNVIENGFDTTYRVSNMIQAEDANGLNLLSQSALFDATLENEHDAVMTMKSFNDVVENQSVADFLKQNYAAENNEQLFGMLKNKETLAALNNTLDSLIGSDMFNRFTFEDLTMMRDLNADMNNTLFTNNDKHLQIAGNITPWNFDGNTGSNARYALYNTTFSRGSLGLGIAFSDIRSNNGRNDKDSRYDQTFQMSVPMGYKTNGIKFISTPRFGYAYGTYDRTGYEGKNYDGKIEKRMFGLMNEARYPISFGNWSIAPAVEFNALGYHIKGKEDVKEYSLNINSQNNYSVESGLGLYANRELKPTKNSTLKLNAGVAVYHEFADPYALELGMNGMDGSFTVRDERRKDNRAVIRTGFDYGLGDDITLIGSFATYIDGTTHNNANLDFKYNF